MKKEKCTYDNLILIFTIIADTRLQLKLIILTFWSKFQWEGYFPCETKKWTQLLNSTNSYWTRFQNFRLNWQLDFFGTNFARADFPVLKKVNTTMEFFISKLDYNCNYNILELYNVSVKVWFLTRKQNLISSVTQLVHELPHELQHNLRLKKLVDIRINKVSS